MRSKLIVFLVLPILALVLSGCDSGTTAMGPKGFNVLGIVKYEEAVYRPNKTTGMHASTSELWNRNNPSGDRLSLFWDGVTWSDY